MQNNNGQQRNGTVYTAPLPKLRHVGFINSYFNIKIESFFFRSLMQKKLTFYRHKR
jgi:hypothetical protein